MSSLPKTVSKDSADKVKEFYNRYFTKKIAFPANEIDAVVGFFEKRGFGKSSATSVAGVLLQQAKIDNIKTFELLDGIKNFNKIFIPNYSVIFNIFPGGKSIHLLDYLYILTKYMLIMKFKSRFQFLIMYKCLT